MRVQRDLTARQENQRQHRCHGDGHHERCAERDDIGETERRKQPALDAGQKEHRHEYQHDDQGREHDRALDFDGRVEYDLREGQARGKRLRRVLPQAAHDVLDDDDRIVHQRTERDGQATERHRVQGAAECRKREQCRNQRQGQCNQGDQRGAHGQQEEEYDRDDQRRAVAQRGQQVVDGAVDEIGLAEDM